MKVNYEKNRDITFNGFYNNKALLKGLEFAAKNGTLFAATTTLGLSIAMKPFETFYQTARLFVNKSHF